MPQKKPASKKQSSRKISKEHPSIAAFEKAFTSVMKGQFGPGHKQMSAIADDEDAPFEIRSRARLFAEMCEARQTSGGSNEAGPYTEAVFEKNRGNLDRAMELVTKELRKDKSSEALHHLAASIHALRGDAEKAVEHLRPALETNPALVSQVRADADFDSVKWAPAYRDLITSVAARR